MVGAEQYGFLEVLAVDAETQIVAVVTYRRQRHNQTHSKNPAVADHIQRSQGGDVALGTHTVESEQIVRAGKPHQVGAGQRLHLVGIFRRRLHLQGQAVGLLPQIVVAQGGIQARMRRAIGVAIVEIDITVQRQFILYFQLHFHRARRTTRPQQRYHIAIRALPVQGGQLILHQRQIRHRVRRQRRHLCANTRGGKITRPGDTQAFDTAFHHAQPHHAVAHFLFRQIHQHRRITGVAIVLFQLFARGFHVFDASFFTQVGIQHAFDIRIGQQGIALDPVLPDIEARCRLCGFFHGHIVIGPPCAGHRSESGHQQRGHQGREQGPRPVHKKLQKKSRRSVAASTVSSTDDLYFHRHDRLPTGKLLWRMLPPAHR